MNIDEFAVKIQEVVQKMLGEEFIVKLQNVTKNNNRIRKGLSIRERNEPIAPTIYIDEFYHWYPIKEIEELACEVCKQYDLCKYPPKIDTENLMSDFEQIKSKLFCRVINLKSNEDFLKNVPYRKFLDLAITYRILVNQDEDGISSILVTNEMMNNWNREEEEIYQESIQNTKGYYPETVDKLSNVIQELLDSESDDVSEMNELFVMTNRNKINGATSLVYAEEQLEELAENLQSSLFILPSSLHEVLITSSFMKESKHLLRMVREINESLVDPEEILSNNIYFYDKQNHVLSVIEE